MTRLAFAFAAVAAFGISASAHAAAPAAPSTSPLKALCDKICGGTWVAANRPTDPEARYSGISYVWDDRAKVIIGHFMSMRGEGEVVTAGLFVLGASPDGKMLWMMQTNGNKGITQPELSVSANGYQWLWRNPEVKDGSYAITRVSVDSPSELTEVMEIVTPDEVIMGAPDQYRRQP